MAIHQHEAFVNQFQYLGHDPMVPRRDSRESLWVFEKHIVETCQNQIGLRLRKRNVVPNPILKYGLNFRCFRTCYKKPTLHPTSWIRFGPVLRLRSHCVLRFWRDKKGGFERLQWSKYRKYFWGHCHIHSKCPNIRGLGGLGGLPAGTFFENDPLANAHEIQGTGGAW